MSKRLKVPEAVLERYEAADDDYEALEAAALEQLRVELKGKAAINAAADRLAGSGSGAPVDDTFRGYAREAVSAALNAVLGEQP